AARVDAAVALSDDEVVGVVPAAVHEAAGGAEHGGVALDAPGLEPPRLRGAAVARVEDRVAGRSASRCLHAERADAELAGVLLAGETEGHQRCLRGAGLERHGLADEARGEPAAAAGGDAGRIAAEAH